MKTNKKRLLVILMVLFFGGTFLFSTRHLQAASPQGVLKQAIHWSTSADWLDPATGGYSTSIFLPMYLFHDALLKSMPEGLYTPCLAESWSISSDRKVYEFKLRKGVKFHNGDTMTAEDVIFSFWRYKAASAKFIHDKTERVEAINPHLVRFRFKEPFPDFLDYLLPGSTTIGWVVPKKYVEKVGDAEYKKHPVGCGPYKFVEFVPGVKLVGEAFEGFWRKVPKIKRMEIYTILEASTRLAMIGRDEIDIATQMTSLIKGGEVKNYPKLKLFLPLSPAQRIVYIAAQWDPKSPWSDPRVRKAASLAIDRKTLADVFYPGAGPIGGLGLKGDPLALEFHPDPYDPEGAKKLLAEAGYPKGFHAGKFYPVQGGQWPYGEQIATYWKAVGITVDTVLLDRPAWWAFRQGGKMKGGLSVDPIGAPTIGGNLSYLFGVGSYGNYPDIKRLWESYLHEVSPEARKDLIGKVQRLIHEKTMWIALTMSSTPSLVGPRVKGNPWKIQPFLFFPVPFEDLALEK